MQNNRDKSSTNIITEHSLEEQRVTIINSNSFSTELTYNTINELDEKINSIIKKAKNEVYELLEKATRKNYEDDNTRITTVMNLFSSAIAKFGKAKLNIEEQWVTIINSNSFYDKLGYKALLDETKKYLRIYKRTNARLEEKNAEYAKINKKIKILEQYYNPTSN